MREYVVAAVIMTGLASTEVRAQCLPEPQVNTPTRSGNRVEVVVDFCAPPAPPAGGGGGASPAVAAPAVPAAAPAAAAPAAAAPGAGPQPGAAAAGQVFDLYANWAALSASIVPASPAAPVGGAAGAAPAAAAAAPAAGGATNNAFANLLGIPAITDPVTDELKGVRIDERDNVTIKLRHFNFINFAAEYAVDTKVIEAYVTLNTLWSQALGLARLGMTASAGAQPCPAGATFSTCVKDWMWALTLSSRRLDEAVARHRQNVGLSETVINTQVVPEARVIQAIRGQLLQLQSETLSRQPETMQDIEWYQQVQAAHDKLLGQINAYVRLAELTATGQTKPIDKQKAGTLVTVKITAMNLIGNPHGQPVEISYFVHSRLPVKFHAGYLYSNLKEVKFDQVRTIAGADLFQQVQDPDSVQTYAAFLSYELVSRNTGRYGAGLLATLGTDFKEPGKRLFVGASVRVLSRVYVGFGALSGTVAEGQNKVVEQLGDRLGTRELFTAVTSRREWKPFFHLSFGVFN
jgi:hypothetical protein